MNRLIFIKLGIHVMPLKDTQRPLISNSVDTISNKNMADARTCTVCVLSVWDILTYIKHALKY